MALSASRIGLYSRFVKLEHTVFSLPLIYAGTLLRVRGWPSVRVLCLILLAAVGARTAAMGLNRLIDLDIDRKNPRTQSRELARGALALWEGWAIVALGILVYFISAGHLAPLCLAFAPVPLLLFLGYPYLKRVTSLTHLGLGLTWSMAPLGGWLAVSPSLDNLAQIGWLWLFALLWVAGFDIIYATMDEEFDREAGLHSLPAKFGSRLALLTAALLHALAFVALMQLWYREFSGWLPLVPLAGIGALLIWEHAVADKRPEFAFFNLNAPIGFLVLAFVWFGV